MNRTECQIYKYTSDHFILEKNSADYFAKEFVTKEIDDKKVVWLNFHSTKSKDSIQTLCDSLQIDKLSFEDIYENNNRPKIEEYPNYLYFSIRSALPNSGLDKNLKQEQISFFLGKHYLISFQEKSSDHFTIVRERIEKNKGQLRQKGADFLLYRMLDAIIDNYFEVLEEITENSNRLEQIILNDPKSDVLQEIEKQKRKLNELKKIVSPLKEATSQLAKSSSHLISDENNYFFKDLRDNCMTVIDEIENNKLNLDGMSSLYFAIQGQRMNEIMKLLTIVSSIFIPLTFITGVYGMNFDFMPELSFRYGYYTIIGIMIIISLILVYYFKKKDWFK